MRINERGCIPRYIVHSNVPVNSLCRNASNDLAFPRICCKSLREGTLEHNPMCDSAKNKSESSDVDIDT